MGKQGLALKRLRRQRGDNLTTRWYESLVVKSAALTAVVLFFGYATSVYYSVQNLNYFAKIAHDPEIEELLGKHLQNLKEIHRLRQKIILSEVRQYIPPALRLDASRQVSDKQIKEWIEKANIQQHVDTKDAAIRRLNQDEIRKLASEGHEDIAWISRDTLRIFQYVVTFPRGMIFLEYQPAEELRQRYQILGEKLPEEIRPAIISANVLILAVTFIILIGMFLFFARNFKIAVQRLIDGFMKWSEKDATFRFSNQWSGELRLITAQFNAMAEEVEANRKRSLYLEKIASWQTIARKLAHEIKNPLTPIQMMVSQIKRRYGGEDPEYTALLNEAQTIISEEVDGLRRMVDNFSQFARLPVPSLESGDLLTTVSHAVELQKAAFSQHTITFTSSLSEAQAHFDASLLRQVVTNLVKNAGEAMQEPGRIDVSVDAEGKFFLIGIEDNGPGIPEEMLTQVFEAYFTTKHTGPNPGMGLGLAICQKIVVDHKGELTLTSVPGRTRFVIKLPMLKG